MHGAVLLHFNSALQAFLHPSPFLSESVSDMFSTNYTFMLPVTISIVAISSSSPGTISAITVEDIS